MTGPIALFVGDVSLDLTMTVSHVPAPDEKVHATTAIEAPGGVGANAAVACALAEVPTRLAIAVGDDPVGRMIIDQLEGKKVDVRWQPQPGASCRVVTLVEPHGEKRLVLHPGVSMYPPLGQLSPDLLTGIGWLHSAVYDIPAAEWLTARCRESGVPWSLDLEPSTFPEGIDRLERCIAGAAVVFCNARSIAAIGQDAVGRLLALAVGAVVETRGGEGARLHLADCVVDVPAPRGPVLDTTGAGDCLAGWFVAKRLRGAAPQAALKTAVIAATMSCGRLGTQTSYPTLNDVIANGGRMS
jgi:ribokinase